MRKSMQEFDLAWKEYFKDKPKPKTDEEEKGQMEKFTHWYNYVRKQTDTGKTPAEMHKEIYGKEPDENSQEPSRMHHFHWDENYDEELIGWIYELQEYDNEKGYKLEYEEVKKKLDPIINRITKKGEKALDLLYELLENGETWSCLFALETLGKIKSEKSVSHLIDFIEKNEHGEWFEGCEPASHALINIGKPAVDKIIFSINIGLDNKIHYCYLCETLSKIKDKRGKEFRLRILKDYLKNPENYESWFELTMFICDFNEDDKEALPCLKQLKEFSLGEEEKRELKDAIEHIENPEEYKEKINREAKEIEKLFNNNNKEKIGRNKPCPCGSGKKYKKCCLV